MGDTDDVFAAKNRLGGIGLVRDAHPLLNELRDQCPVHRGSISGFFGITGPDNYFTPNDEQHTVFDWTEVDRGFRDAVNLSSSYVGPALRQVIGRTILEMDPPEHQRYRSLLQGAFTKKEMDRWETGFVRDMVVAQLDRLVPLGRADLAADFAFHYPISLIAVAAGLPVEHIPEFYEQAAKLTNVAFEESERLAASAELEAMTRAVIAERRVEPRDDLITVLLQAEVRQPDGERASLTDDEIVDFVRLLVPAGAQTTYRTLTNLLYGLLTHPDQYELLVQDRTLIPKAIEEGLRWEPPLVAFGRIATNDFEIAGHPIEAGSTVNLCVHSANRDPSRWDDPDTFDITRPLKGHVSFGQGNHICLGMHFARMELRVALEEIIERLPNLRLDPDADDLHISGLFARSAIRLPCVWDAPEREDECVNTLKDRVCIITGAGRGLGREHALLFAAEGAKVVVNDLGGNADGSGSDSTPAQEVVDEIVATGGEAVANYDDVSTWDGAERLVQTALDTFGDLHVLVNNAGILRDRMLTNMSEDEWDAVMKVHLKGHFCPTRMAAGYWREQSKAGVEVPRAVVNTSSTSGLFGNVGQTNYGAAKTGIATFSIIANAELRRYGVRVNAIAPAAATRLTARLSGVDAEPDPSEWSPMDPANVSPFVAYLSTADCPINGRVFFVIGGEVHLFQPFAIVDTIAKDGRWTVEELAAEGARLQDYEFDYGHPLGRMISGG